MPYRKHFGLTRHPFDKDLAEGDLFETTALAELTARLRHLLDMRGIGLVTGESGSGKTTACRQLVANLNTGLHRVLYVSLTTRRRSETDVVFAGIWWCPGVLRGHGTCGVESSGRGA